MRIGVGLWLQGGRPGGGAPIVWDWQGFTMSTGDSGAWIGYSNGDIAYPPFNPPVGMISGQPTAVTDLVALFQDVGSGDIVAVFHGSYGEQLQLLEISLGGFVIMPSGFSEMGGNTWLRFSGLPGDLSAGETYEVMFGWDLKNAWEILSDLLLPGSTALEILWPDPRFWFSDEAGMVPWVSGPIRGWRSTAGTLFSQPTNADFAPSAGALQNGNAALSFDGVDDWLQSAASLPFGNPRVEGQTFYGIRSRKVSGGWVTAWESSNISAGYWAVAQLGSSFAPEQGGGAGSLGAVQYRVNQSDLTPRTRGELFTRTENVNAIITSQNVALITAPYRLSGYTSSFVNALVGPIVLQAGSGLDPTTITAAEDIINDHMGAY